MTCIRPRVIVRCTIKNFVLVTTPLLFILTIISLLFGITITTTTTSRFLLQLGQFLRLLLRLACLLGSLFGLLSCLFLGFLVHLFIVLLILIGSSSSFLVHFFLGRLELLFEFGFLVLLLVLLFVLFLLLLAIVAVFVGDLHFFHACSNLLLLFLAVIIIKHGRLGSSFLLLFLELFLGKLLDRFRRLLLFLLLGFFHTLLLRLAI
mmetsp:Transcript_35523/g.60403  ORF Transcript_35523/g.60403 Transcript_35523/m.60403 type:complete len:206 (+) Transcript_35523:2100-2717(+)